MAFLSIPALEARYLQQAIDALSARILGRYGVVAVSDSTERTKEKRPVIIIFVTYQDPQLPDVIRSVPELWTQMGDHPHALFPVVIRMSKPIVTQEPR